MSIDRLAAALAGIIFEARRRDETHFDRQPLPLPAGAVGAIACARDLVRVVAQAAGVPVRDASAEWPTDAVGELLRLELQHAGERMGSDDAAQAPACADTRDWEAQVRAMVLPLRTAHEAHRLPRFDELPGLVHRIAGDGRTRYLRCGDGAVGLLLVNAFGLPMDVWHEFARHVSTSVRVLALDGHAGAEDAIDPYYGGPDAPVRFVRAVQAVLASEGLGACHVASWCGGAKYALELAFSMPDAVSSITLFAPSFAGEPARDDAEGGGDSAFEASLATMCQVVQRMPNAAAGMARSMQALLARGAPVAPAADATGAALFALHDRVTTPWLHAPFEGAARMQAYSRQLLAFRAHDVAPEGREGRPGMPLMLVTGDQDATTNNRRARVLSSGWSARLAFELRLAGHYFVHQNAALVAGLLLGFLRDGIAVEAPHPRLVRQVEAPMPQRAEEALVTGEL